MIATHNDRSLPAAMNPFMAQVLIDPTYDDPVHGRIVYRRSQKGFNVRRMLNDGPVLQSLGQWEAIVGNVIQAAGSIGAAAVSASLAPRPQSGQAPPPVSRPAAVMPVSLPIAPSQAATTVVQTIAGQETTPAHYPTPQSSAAVNQLTLASLESNPTMLIAGGAAFLLLLVLLMRK